MDGGPSLPTLMLTLIIRIETLRGAGDIQKR